MSLNHCIVILTYPDKLLAKGSIFLIKIYQKTISPDHSELGKTKPFHGCKFYPSCSEYGIKVIKKHGFIFGLPKMIWRIMRCNPWNKGGIDEPK